MFSLKLFKNNIFKNATSLSFNHGIQVLTQLFFIPLYLTYWDLNTYSEWILISTIPAILTISELGLTSYGLNLVVIQKNQNKINKANFSLQNIIFFTTLILATVSCILLILNYLFNFQEIFNITSLDQSDFILVLSFIFIRFLIYSNSSFLSGLFRINHKFHLTIYIKSFFNVTEIILIWLVLLYGGQILEVSFISVLNYLVALFVIYILAKAEFKWLKIVNFKNINFLFIKKIFYPSISFMTGNVSKGLIAQSTIILLNLFTIDAFVIFYNSLRLVINGARHFINIISTSYYPEITINYAKKAVNKISKQFKFLVKYNFYSSTIIFIAIIILIERPFLIWTKNEIPWDFTFFIAFLIASYIEWIGIPIQTMPFAINKAEVLNKVFVISFIVYAFLLYILLTFQISLAIPIALLSINLYGLIHSWVILKKNIILNKITK